MFESIKKDTWSKYTRHSIWQTVFIGFIVGNMAIVGLIILTIENLTFEFNDRILIFVAIVGAIITIIIAFINYLYQDKQLQTTSMTKIFELLSSPDVRQSRSIVHEKYCEFENKLEVSFNTNDPELKIHVDRVISSFDQVSVLVLNDLVNEDLFFDTYGEMIVRDWNTLEVEITRRQKNNPSSIKHFTELKRRFLKRIENENSKRKKENRVKVEPYCE